MSQLDFDEKGNIIWPEWLRIPKEEEQRRIKLIKTFKKKLIFHYHGFGIGESFIKCEFGIELPKVKNISEKILEIQNWTNKNVELKRTAKILLKEIENGCQLIISGRGHDGRCTWCRSFRTALSTNLFNDRVAVCQKGCCKFDKREYKKIKIFGVR